MSDTEEKEGNKGTTVLVPLVSVFVSFIASLYLVKDVIPGTVYGFDERTFLIVNLVSLAFAAVSSIAGVIVYNRQKAKIDNDTSKYPEHLPPGLMMFGVIVLSLAVSVVAVGAAFRSSPFYETLPSLIDIKNMATIDTAGNDNGGVTWVVALFYVLTWHVIVVPFAITIGFFTSFGTTFRDEVKGVSQASDEKIIDLAEATAIDQETSSKWIGIQNDIDWFLSSPTLFLIGGKLREDSTNAIDDMIGKRAGEDDDQEAVTAYLESAKSACGVIDSCIATAKANGPDGLLSDARDVYDKAKKANKRTKTSDITAIFAIDQDMVGALASGSRKSITSGLRALGRGKS